MTVTPVIDYEPRVVTTGTRPVAIGSAARRSPARQRTREHAPPIAPSAASAQLRAAAAFADAALRGVLEVIDRRRSPVHLRALLSAGLVDSVASFSQSGSGSNTSAVLRRVRLQAVCPGETAFEVAATYSRGPRVHAIACRVQHIAAGHDKTWQVVALHIG